MAHPLCCAQGSFFVDFTYSFWSKPFTVHLGSSWSRRLHRSPRQDHGRCFFVCHRGWTHQENWVTRSDHWTLVTASHRVRILYSRLCHERELMWVVIYTSRRALLYSSPGKWTLKNSFMSNVDSKIKQYEDKFNELKSAFQDRAILQTEIIVSRMFGNLDSFDQRPRISCTSTINFLLSHGIQSPWHTLYQWCTFWHCQGMSSGDSRYDHQRNHSVGQ